MIDANKMEDRMEQVRIGKGRLSAMRRPRMLAGSIVVVVVAAVLAMLMACVSAFASESDSQRAGYRCEEGSSCLLCAHESDYCLVDDIASKINALPEDKDVKVENAAWVIDQIHAIDRLKVELTEGQYEELLALIESGDDGSGFSVVPMRYARVVDAIQKLGGNSLLVTKKYVAESGSVLDVSKAQVSLKVTSVASGETLNLTLSSMSAAQNTLSAALGFYSVVEDGVGWTFRYILPDGVYLVEELGDFGAKVGDGSFETSYTTYQVDGGEATCAAGLITLAGGQSAEVLVENSNAPTIGDTGEEANTEDFLEVDPSQNLYQRKEDGAYYQLNAEANTLNPVHVHVSGEAGSEAYEVFDKKVTAEIGEITAGNWYLDGNVERGGYVTISGDATVCLNGCTWALTHLGNKEGLMKVAASKSLALIDPCHVAGDDSDPRGALSCQRKDGNWLPYALEVKDNASLALDNVRIKGGEGCGGVIAHKASGVKVSIKNTVFDVGAAPMRVDDARDYEITAEDSVFSGYNGAEFYAGGEGKAVFKECSLTNGDTDGSLIANANGAGQVTLDGGVTKTMRPSKAVVFTNDPQVTDHIKIMYGYYHAVVLGANMSTSVKYDVRLYIEPEAGSSKLFATAGEGVTLTEAHVGMFNIQNKAGQDITYCSLVLDEENNQLLFRVLPTIEDKDGDGIKEADSNEDGVYEGSDAELGKEYVINEDGEAVEKGESGESSSPSNKPGLIIPPYVDPDPNCPIDRFPDANSDAWYHDGMHWAIGEGFVRGYGDGSGKLGPLDSTTRAQLVAILYRLAGEPAVSAVERPFPDVASGSWYFDAISWAKQEGVVVGYTGGDRAGCFGPNDTLSREQLAVILQRYNALYGNGSLEGSSSLAGFPDADKASGWALDGLKWAVANGVLSGYGDTGELAPQADASRAELATMLGRMFND